jgi:hypothetical protein
LHWREIEAPPEDWVDLVLKQGERKLGQSIDHLEGMAWRAEMAGVKAGQLK